MPIAAQLEIDVGEEPPVAASVVGSHGGEAPVLASLELVMNLEHHVPTNHRGQTRHRRDGQQQSPQIHFPKTNTVCMQKAPTQKARTELFSIFPPKIGALCN